MQNASKVGLMVVVFVALMAGAYQFLGQRFFKPETMKITASFPDAGGINAGSRVLMAGVKVGQVEKVELAGPNEARLTLSIDKSTQIPKGSYATLPTSLIGIGDNPVQIIAPTKQATAFLSDGDTISGKKLGALEGILPDLGPTLSEVQKTLSAVREVVEDREIRDQLVAVLGKTSTTLEEFGKLANSANIALSENRGTINATLKTFGVAMKDVQRTAAMAADLLADPKYREQAAGILESLALTAKRADEVMAGVQSIVSDPNLKSTLDATLVNAKTMSETGTRIASNAEKMTEDGTKITENGIKISKNVEELTAKANNLADEAKSVFEKIKQFFEKTPGTSSLKNLETQMDVQSEINPGRFRTDVTATYPIPDGKIYVGMYDAFESNRLIAQFQRPAGKDLNYRYGVYAGQPGFGVDYRLAPRLQIRGDLYGLNERRLDIGARFDITRDFLGYVGVNRVADGNTLTVGVGIKK